MACDVGPPEPISRNLWKWRTESKTPDIQRRTALHKSSPTWGVGIKIIGFIQLKMAGHIPVSDLLLVQNKNQCSCECYPDILACADPVGGMGAMGQTCYPLANHKLLLV